MTKDDWLNTLSIEQLDQVMTEIDRIIDRRKSKVRNPGAAKIDDLAANLGLDLSLLQREISRK